MKQKISSFNFTEQEKRIFTAITEKPALVFGNTAESLSKMIFTSPSALNRFSKKMGYKGFSDFKINFALNQNSHQVGIELENSGYAPILSQYLPVLYERVIKKNNAYLLSDNSDVFSLSNAIKNIKCIDIYAAGINYDIATAMSYKIKNQHIAVNVFNFVDVSYLQKESAENHLAIIISRTGRNPMCLYAAEQCKLFGINTLSISRESCFEIADKCDYSLHLWFPFDENPLKNNIISISLGYFFDFLSFTIKNSKPENFIHI